MRALVVFLFISNFCSAQSFSMDTLLMGSAFNFTGVAENEKLAKTAVRAGIEEVVRIEKLISSWDPKSQTSNVNRNAGIKPIKVSKELLDLVIRSKTISELSNGYFDISFASIAKTWVFDQKEIKTLPSKEKIEASCYYVNFENIEVNLNDSTLFLVEKGMKIGFGAIGKGYAADKAKAIMFAHGAKSGVVNAGGDLLAWGQQENGDPWSIGIADPNSKEGIKAWLNATDMAVVTSGNYEKYFMYNGQKYCHIINPKTGWPVTGTKSVTLISPSAEFCDALATTVFILGPEEGMALINHLDGVEGIIINDLNESVYSNNLKTNFIYK